MQTVYKLNADELNNEFLESIKALFPHKTIEVAIHEVDDENQSPPTAGLQRAKFSPFPAQNQGYTKNKANFPFLGSCVHGSLCSLL